jgi:hypothetical protein
MPFDWKEYLELARFLQGQTGGPFAAEAAFRSAVSRAYYAAFGHALQYAADYLGFVPRTRPEEKAQDHGRLRAHMARRRRRQVAETLDDLRQWRNECDYVADLPGMDLPALVGNALAAAEYGFNSLTPPASPSP